MHSSTTPANTLVGRNRTSLNYILKKYVQEYKDELKLMDEDFEEDENEEEEDEPAPA